MTDTIFVCQHCGKTTKMEGVKIIEDDKKGYTKAKEGLRKLEKFRP